jgi:hypothetical protein
MTMQMNFRPGQMVSYISTRNFALGSTGFTVQAQMEVLFDGTNVEVGGQKFVLPTLRGAIKLQWLVPSDQYDENAPIEANPSANIQVRSANDLGQIPMQPVKKNAITTVESDERIVMSRGQRAEAAQQHTQQVRQQQQRTGGVARQTGQRSGIEMGGAEFGVPVSRSFLTPARAETKVTPDTVGTAIRNAELVKVQPGEGISEDQLMAQMTEEQRYQYQAEKEARKGDVMSRMAGYVPPPAQTTNLAAYNQPGQQRQAPAPQQQRAVVAAQPQSRVVAQVPQGQRVSQSEGIQTTLSTGGGTEIADPTGMGGKVHESVTQQEGITFRNTNGPKKAMPGMQTVGQPQQQAMNQDDGTQSRIDKDGTADTRRKIAKALCQDFPDAYEFSDHWKRRLAMIRLNFETRVDVIRAIFAAESDDFKRVLMEEFPEAFAA